MLNDRWYKSRIQTFESLAKRAHLKSSRLTAFMLNGPRDTARRNAYTLSQSALKKTDPSLRRLTLTLPLAAGLLPLALSGCAQGYSPNTYASNAAQEEANVQPGVIIGVRQVTISASGTVGAASGGAAGGVAGAQLAGGPVGTALGAIAGTLVGGIGGTAAAQAVADAKGWEYIVQETGGKLVSVTQTSKTALPIGQHVLVIADSQQARIVPDYIVRSAEISPSPSKAATTPNSLSAAEIHLTPPQPAAAGTVAPLQVAPIAVTGSPPTPAAPNPVTATPGTASPAPASGGAAPPKAASNSNTATEPAPGSATPAPGPATPAASATTAPQQ